MEQFLGCLKIQDFAVIGACGRIRPRFVLRSRGHFGILRSSSLPGVEWEKGTLLDLGIGVVSPAVFSSRNSENDFRPGFQMCCDALQSPRHAGGNRLLRNRLSMLRGYRRGKFPPACRGLCRVIPVLFYRENSEKRRGRPLFFINYFRPRFISDPVSFLSPTSSGGRDYRGDLRKGSGASRTKSRTCAEVALTRTVGWVSRDCVGMDASVM